jgi:plastocyanin
MGSLLLRWARPLLAAGCAAVLLGSSPGAAQDAIEVRMRNNLYEPAQLTVPAGTSVRFVNLDADIHTVSDRGGAFESGLMFNRDAWTYVFNNPGTYEYFCLPHPFMVATITVQ